MNNQCDLVELVDKEAEHFGTAVLLFKWPLAIAILIVWVALTNLWPLFWVGVILAWRRWRR